MSNKPCEAAISTKRQNIDFFFNTHVNQNFWIRFITISECCQLWSVLDYLFLHRLKNVQGRLIGKVPKD